MLKDTATTVRMITVSTTTSYQALAAVVKAALALKSAPANTLPDGHIVEVRFQAGADITIKDAYTGDDVVLSTGAIYSFPILNPLDDIFLKTGAGTDVTVMLFIHEAL